MNEKKKNNALRNGIILIVVFLLGMGGMYFIAYKFPVIIGEVVTKEERKVSITDNGIAEAVDKLYDSVVVVNSYYDNGYSSGTGFVYKVDGNKAYILTNNHVIKDANEVNVTFTDDTVVKADVVGSDTYSDIAVLSLSKEHIKGISEIGDSNKARLGDTVFAIGSPIDSEYSWSVTRGIVSGKNRLVEVPLDDGYDSMVVNTIQTDTAINNGNSGGPLANSNGEVIGITSIKLADEKVEGMGFAIPIEIALGIADELIKNKTVTRPFLGINMIDVKDAYYTRQYNSLVRNLEDLKGVVVSNVEKKSPADLAGIESLDIITKIDGNKVSSKAFLRYYLYSHKPGDTMKVTVIRDGKEKEINVKLTDN